MSICSAITQFNRGFMTGASWSLGFGIANFINNSLFGFNSFMPFGFGFGFGNFYEYPDYQFSQLPQLPTYPEMNGSIWDFSSAQQANYNISTSMPNFDIFTPAFGSAMYPFEVSTKNTGKTDNSAKKGNDIKTRVGSFTSSAETFGVRMAENASYYVGKVNNDKEGNTLFSNGVTQHWCADFVTTIAKKTYGSKLPSNFGQAFKNGASYGSSSVYGLLYWGENNNCYLEVPQNEGPDAKAEFIAENVKEGDIMIEKRGGKSHTGIVTKVYDDGSFDTVEGNCSDSVAKRHYNANSNTLSGFVSLSQFA